MPLAPQRHLRDLLILSNRFVDTPLRSVLDHFQLTTVSLTGCSKGPSNKAADETKPEAYPSRYAEDFLESRTKLVGLFSALRGGDYGWPQPLGYR